jgi:hypothetical protein
LVLLLKFYKTLKIKGTKKGFAGFFRKDFSRISSEMKKAPRKRAPRDSVQRMLISYLTLDYPPSGINSKKN